MALGDLGRHARAYTKRGLHIFPVHSVDSKGTCSCGRACDAPGKHPRIKDWEREAVANGARVGTWWTRWPGSNIGLALGPSGLVVIDVDPRNGGEESHFALAQRLGSYQTIRSITGGGGTHDFFRAPTTALRTGANAFGDEYPGVDVKGVGGYVVLPPSSHASGRSYAWEAEQHGTIEVLPSAWAAALARPAKRLVAGDSDEPILEGQRRQALLRLAGRLRRYGATAETIRDVLHAANTRQCRPLLEAREVDAIANDVSQRYRPAMHLAPRDGR